MYELPCAVLLRVRVLETEAKIVLQAHGFDPGMGILRTDKRYCGSLARDLMDPLRPVVDGPRH